MTRLAKALFKAADASIVLVENGVIWRSRQLAGGVYRPAPGPEYAMRTGELLWMADAMDDPRFDPADFTLGEFKTGFYAAAPVRLADGSTPGALTVFATEPREFDKTLADRLMDLAATVADECDRARIAKAAAASAAALADARGMIDALVDGAPIAWALTDSDLRLLDARPLLLQALDIDREASLGRSLLELAPDQAEALREGLEACLAGRSFGLSRLRLERGGQVQWLESELTPRRDPAGDVVGVILTAHDVTGLVQAMERTKRSEERLQMALELAEIYVSDMDYENKTLEMAGAVEVFFDRPDTFEMLHADPLVRVDPRDRPRIESLLEAYLKGGQVFRPEFRIRRGDDQEVWAVHATQVFRDEAGCVKRWVSAGQNITHRKVAERALIQAKEAAEAANRAKSSFLANMSHEIRTPLNGMLGMAQAMALDVLEPAQRERLAVIRQSGETLLAILNDVLDLSKIEAGKLELESIPFDIAQLARGVQDVFAPSAQAKGCGFEVVVAPEAAGVYAGDPTRVRQILYNLVSNALKFTEHGQVRVDVAASAAGLVIKVKDTGIGMSTEQVAKLFRKFEQADASTTRRFGGTGLGLAICHELANLMGGDIVVESQLGQGATFLIRLPLHRLGDVATEQAAAGDADFSGPPLRVLAAEDNAVNQKVLCALLKHAGVEPCIVGNGREALEAWEARPWDVILMDVNMPQMDGPTATRMIRERETVTGRARTPIVALTANAMAHQVEEYLAAGMDDFVAKPIEVARLFAALEAAVERGRPAEERALAG
ncbi:MAG: response regulator [Caulobacteraceae bacterium]|nr:response regulator [Caulobacteraceae bacterium]